jgi:predicted outer membrane repeat protein
VINSSFSKNNAFEKGGAIAIENSNIMTMTGCNLSENTARYNIGGGIYALRVTKLAF